MRVGDLPTVPEQYAGVFDQAGECREQARLAGADLPDQQHQFAGLHGEIHVADADRAVVVDSREAGESQALQRYPPDRLWLWGIPADEVHSRWKVHQVGTAREPAGDLLPCPRPRRLGDHHPGDPAEPVETADRVGHEQGDREAPAAPEVDRPRRHDAGLHHDRGHAVEQGLHPMLLHRGRDATRVHVAQVGMNLGDGCSQLDGAPGVQHRDERPAEPRAGRG